MDHNPNKVAWGDLVITRVEATGSGVAGSAGRCPSSTALLEAIRLGRPRERREVRLSWHYAPWSAGRVHLADGTEYGFRLYLGGLIEFDRPLPGGVDTLLVPLAPDG